MTSRAAELLAADPFASRHAIRLIEASPERVAVGLDPRPDHFDEQGRLTRTVAFALADCAMSLISNSTDTSLAIDVHLVVAGQAPVGAPITATAVPTLADGRRRTWHIEVESDGVLLARFTGTTFTVAG